MGEQAIEEFARAVGALKERSGLSYGALAKRLHMSTSTLHRYCSGAAVPVEYAPVERLARACGAGREDLIELHRLWVLADVARNRTREPEAPRPSAAPSAATPPPAPSAARPPAGPEAPPPRPARGPAPDRDAGAAVPGPASPTAAAAGPAPSRSAAPAARPGDGGAAAPADRPGELAPGGGRTARRRGRRLTRPLTAGLAIVVLAVAVAVAVQLGGDDPGEERSARPGSGGASSAPGTPPAGSGPPLDHTVRSHLWQGDCGQDYLLDREPAAVPEPPLAQDAEEWAERTDAVYGGTRIVEVTLRTTGSAPVTVHALHVRLTDRDEPLPWNVYGTSPGCGGSLSVATFLVDLDEQPPTPVATDGFDGETMKTLPAPALPYQITAEEPLVLRTEAVTATCTCEWYLEVAWSSGGERGTLRIDDDGRPFRVSAVEGNTRYAYDDSWVPEAR